jgi:hypothetical protein
VLEAEVIALREGRTADADVLRRAREAAVAPVVPAETPAETAEGRVIEVTVSAAEEIPAGEIPADDEAVDAVPADGAVEESEAAERR